MTMAYRTDHSKQPTSTLRVITSNVQVQDALDDDQSFELIDSRTSDHYPSHMQPIRWTSLGTRPDPVKRYNTSSSSTLDVRKSLQGETVGGKEV